MKTINRGALPEGVVRCATAAGARTDAATAAPAKARDAQQPEQRKPPKRAEPAEPAARKTVKK